VTPTPSRAVLWSAAVLVLTALHHVYGAVRYETPWRYHAVQLAAVTLLLILGADGIRRARSGATAGRLAERALRALIWLVPILMIGGFEGLYNHVAKNVLYLVGLSPDWMNRLFPPPTYEMPNDLLFELTGLLQVPPAFLAARALIGSRPG
jgi:hypothetical protein